MVYILITEVEGMSDVALVYLWSKGELDLLGLLCGKTLIVWESDCGSTVGLECLRSIRKLVLDPSHDVSGNRNALQRLHLDFV